ncbi:MAG: RNA polymerase sigma factor RpoH [Proteobacteria bacterium]|nr:RNA polymerase sigma factor RpoH [Pseudomonadota bacterium]
MGKELQLAKVTLPSPDGLASYLQKVNAVPLLSEEEEFDLATRYREQGDLLAAQQLVLSHLRYVVRIAKQYSGYGLNLNDLVQEGTIGLMKAVKRFDPKLKVRLVSFAVHWIKSEIHEFVIRNWRIVKVATTKAQRKLFFNLRQAKKRLGWFSPEEVNAVAQDLGVSTKDVLEMESRLNAHDDTFDPLLDEEETSTHHPAAYLSAPVQSDPAHQIIEGEYESHAQSKLQHALNTLDERSLDIVSNRWLVDEEAKASLKDLAQKHDVSIERVRQLEKAALSKLRNAMGESLIIDPV